jgi:hypothetical protein
MEMPTHFTKFNVLTMQTIDVAFQTTAFNIIFFLGLGWSISKAQ